MNTISLALQVDIVPKDERAGEGQRPPSTVAPPVALSAPAQTMGECFTTYICSSASSS